jgi:hypothetical protein
MPVFHQPDIKDFMVPGTWVKGAGKLPVASFQGSLLIRLTLSLYTLEQMALWRLQLCIRTTILSVISASDFQSSLAKKTSEDCDFGSKTGLLPKPQSVECGLPHHLPNKK